MPRSPRALRDERGRRGSGRTRGGGRGGQLLFEVVDEPGETVKGRGGAARYGTGCLYRPSYVPPSYATRVNARPGGLDWPALTARQEKEWSRLPMVGIAP
ncbi:hypothetical protein OG416_03420 [Streptomyces longwoodensis]|uniref:hypothetical protein n=1 Tax=Streptomyces longwoodensis TaxID=68231 RepID=UPI0030DFE247|nr:hypothetical protein OG416_03420 [Streptomyces longwoodensis]